MIKQLEVERRKKEIQERDNLIKLAKLDKEIRLKNENLIQNEMGYQTSLIKFHKPIIEKFEDHEKTNKEIVKNIQEGFEIISKVPALPEPEPTIYDIDKGLDIHYLKSEKLYRPSDLLDNNEKIEEMYAKAKLLKAELGSKKGNLKSSIKRAKNMSEVQITKKLDEVEEIKHKILVLEKYLNRVGGMYDTEEMKVGKGLNLDLLYELLAKRCKGCKTEKLANQIRLMIDILLKNKTITPEHKEKIYKNLEL